MKAMKKLLQAAAIFAVVVMVTSMLIGIFFRYALNSSLAWADEIALLAFVWLTFLSSAIAVEDNSHVRIEILTDLLPKGVRKCIELLVWLIAAFVGAYMLYMGIEYVLFTLGQRSPAVRYPFWMRNAALPLFGLLAIIFSLKHIKSLMR